MAITNGVVPAGTVVNGTSLFRQPAGPATVLLAASSGTVFVGSGTGVTSANGFPVVAGAVPPVTIPVYAGSAGGQFSVVTGAGGTASLSWMVSDAYGQTGTGTLD